jgi:hypothetical protein
VYRHQFLLFLFLAANIARPTFGADRGSESSAIRSRPGESANVIVTGRLARNSASQPGQAPYILLDGWGMIRSYVSPGADANPERYLGRQVRIAGSTDLPQGGGIPHVTAESMTTAGQTRTVHGAPTTRSAMTDRSVQRVSHNETIQDAQGGGPSAPEPITNGAQKSSSPAGTDRLTPYPSNEPSYTDGIDESSLAGSECSTCGGCGQRSEDCCCYRRGPSGCLWVRAEYLFWWTRGMNTPPLVTSGPSPQQPGYYGAPGTEVLFGDSLINGQGRSGGRLQCGVWLNPCQTFGVEGEYLALGNDEMHFREWSSGDPILSRPFFDVTRPANDPQNVEKVAFPRGNPSSLDGSVSVDALTKFQSAGARLRFYLDSQDCCWSNPCCPEQTIRSGWRTDLLLGYRFLRLDDQLGIREELTSTDREFSGAFLVQDQFNAENQFNGGELGLLIVMHRGRWSLEVIPKVALGSTNEIVNINGSTRTTQADGTNSVASGGLLALSSNIGQYTANEFAVVPELGLNLGYQISPHMQLTFGYSFIYWSRVARAGEQIDFKVNPDLIPNSGVQPDPNLMHPAFAFQETSFWAQGLNFGVACSW